MTEITQAEESNANRNNNTSTTTRTTGDVNNSDSNRMRFDNNNGSANIPDDDHQVNENISNVNPAETEAATSDMITTNVLSTQTAPRHETPIRINNSNNKKPTRFIDAIYRLIGFNSKSNEEKTDCTAREVGTLIMVGVLLVLFIMSISGFWIMWFTEVYNNQYIYKLLLSENSTASEWWMKPPLNTHLKVHIFNYTNIDRYLKGIDKKIKLKDLGPYVYIENATKVNVKYSDNHTISYREHRTYKFSPELSVGRQYDRVVVPNVPLLSVAARMKNNNYLTKAAMNLALSAISLEPFKILPADEMLWGYEDQLIDFSKKFSPEPLPFEKFGMLVNRNGTGRDRYEIFTGEGDIRKLAVISAFNGKSHLDFWSTEECNRIDGTDGSQFPPHLMDKKQNLQVFIQAFCRKLPLTFDTEVNVFDGVPAWRYKTPMNVFSHPKINPDNQCYCHIHSGVCPPSGVFNGTLCYDAPIFVSFPHFFTGDAELFEKFEGLHPLADIHQTYADVHPRLAFPIGGASRIQINIQLHKESFLKDSLNRLDEGIILPVLWIEVTSGELTDDLRTLIYHSSFSANAIQFALKYGTLLTCVTTFALLALGCYYRGRTREISSNEKARELGMLSRTPSNLKNTNEIMTVSGGTVTTAIVTEST